MTEATLTNRVQNLVEDTTHTIAESPRKLVEASRGAFNTTREEAEDLMARGENLFDKLVERGSKIETLQTNRLHRMWKGWEARGRKQFHRAEQMVEHQMQNVLRTFNIPTMDDIKRLDKELDRLSRKLDVQLKEKQLTGLPIEKYDDLTAKEIVAHLSSLDDAGLKAVEQFESVHGQRKTILREIEHRLHPEVA
jgi:hypothetical protein